MFQPNFMPHFGISFNLFVFSNLRYHLWMTNTLISRYTTLTIDNKRKIRSSNTTTFRFGLSTITKAYLVINVISHHRRLLRFKYDFTRNTASRFTARLNSILMKVPRRLRSYPTLSRIKGGYKTKLGRRFWRSTLISFYLRFSLRSIYSKIYTLMRRYMLLR